MAAQRRRGGVALRVLSGAIAAGIVLLSATAAGAAAPHVYGIAVTWQDATGSAGSGFDRTDGPGGAVAYAGVPGAATDLTDLSALGVSITLVQAGVQWGKPILLAPGTTARFYFPAGTYTLVGRALSGGIGRPPAATPLATLSLALTARQAPSTSPSAGVGPFLLAGQRPRSVVSLYGASEGLAPAAKSGPTTTAGSAPRRTGGGFDRNLGLPTAVAIVVLVGIAGAFVRVVLAYPRLVGHPQFSGERRH